MGVTLKLGAQLEFGGRSFCIFNLIAALKQSPFVLNTTELESAANSGQGVGADGLQSCRRGRHRQCGT